MGSKTGCTSENKVMVFNEYQQGEIRRKKDEDQARAVQNLIVLWATNSSQAGLWTLLIGEVKKKTHQQWITIKL